MAKNEYKSYPWGKTYHHIAKMLTKELLNVWIRKEIKE
jgi:hypothetical protein